jgi:hypothetical protein
VGYSHQVFEGHYEALVDYFTQLFRPSTMFVRVATKVVMCASKAQITPLLTALHTQHVYLESPIPVRLR